jgi:hypothetical protein
MAEGDTNLTNLVASGDLTAGDDAVITDDASVGGDLVVTGSITGAGWVLTGSFDFNGTNIDLDPTGDATLDMDATKTATVTLADNLASAFLLKDGTANYLDVDTATGAEKIDLGNAGDNPALNVLGSGQITLTGNVDCSAGVDVSTAALTTSAGLTVSGGAVGVVCTNIDLDPTGTFDLAMDNGQAFSIDIDGVASNISLATDGAAQDLTIEVTGATDSSLVLESAGTGADAVSIGATAGGISIGATTELDLTGASITLNGAARYYLAGDASGVLLSSVGPVAGEGMETYIVDKTVSPAAVETAVFTVPAGAVIELVQANCESALTGGGTTATWSVGINGDVDKYGSAGLYPTQADSLAQNSKSNWVATPTQLASAEAVVLSGAATGGAAAGNTALTVGSVRVVIIYRTYNPLANA